MVAVETCERRPTPMSRGEDGLAVIDGWVGLDVRHLLAFQAIAEEGSFKAAARALGYTPSAVSQQIAGLERVVGAQLIARERGRQAFGPKGNPALRKKYVRQALSTGINRAQIRQALYISPGLVASAKELPVLQSHLFKPFEPSYEPKRGTLELQPAERDRDPREERLHRRPRPAVGQQQQDLELPGRREAQLPLHDDEREPAARPHVRDRAEATEERGHRARAAVRPVRHRLRADPPLR